MIILDGDRHAQLFAGVLVHDGVVALRHRELAQRLEVDAVFRVIGPLQQAEGAGRTQQPIGVGPIAAIVAVVAPVVLAHVGVGEHTDRDLAHAGVDRRGGSRDGARRRAAAGVHLLAEPDLKAEHVAGALRPEHAGAAGAGEAGHDEAVDLLAFKAGLVEQRLEDFSHQHPDVPVAFLHHLRFGVRHDGGVAQAHRSLPSIIEYSADLFRAVV